MADMTTPHPPIVGPPEDPQAAGGRTASPDVWTSTTYFAEGLPYAIVVNLSNLFFEAQGASTKQIGLAAAFHLPWNLKAFVGPFVDAYATKRRWLVVLEALLAVALVGLAFTTTLSNVLTAASVMFLVVAVLSATHDIGIDGFYLEALDKKSQERLVGLRAPAYRVAMLVVSGPIVVFAGRMGWTLTMFLLAAMMATLFVFHALFLPRHEVPKRPIAELLRQLITLRFLLIGGALAAVIAGSRAALKSDLAASLQASVTDVAPRLSERLQKLGAADWIGLFFLLTLLVVLALLPRIRRRIESSDAGYARSFIAFLEQPHPGRILLYIVLFRVGESFLQQMKVPFVIRTLGLTQAEYGWTNGTLGMIASIAAPIVGGILIAKLGFRRCIWPFLLAQNGLHLLFAAAAVFAPEIEAARAPLVGVQVGMQVATIVDLRLLIVTTVILVEIVGAGLGTAAFMVYLIRCCQPAHKAAHMALLTSLMSISFTLAGVFSGFLAEAMGFPLYFAMTFFVTIPGMVLTLFVPHIDEQGSKPRLLPEGSSPSRPS